MRTIIPLMLLLCGCSACAATSKNVGSHTSVGTISIELKPGGLTSRHLAERLVTQANRAHPLKGKWTVVFSKGPESVDINAKVLTIKGSDSAAVLHGFEKAHNAELGLAP